MQCIREYSLVSLGLDVLKDEQPKRGPFVRAQHIQVERCEHLPSKVEEPDFFQLAKRVLEKKRCSVQVKPLGFPLDVPELT